MRHRKNNTAMQMLLRFAREERGSSLVEFTMTALLLVVVVAAVLQWSVAMYAYHFTTYAAQEGSRFAAVRGNTWSKSVATNCSTSAPPSFTMPYECTASSTDIQNYVQSLATQGISTTNLTINTSSSYVWPGITPDCTSSCSACTTNANSQGCLVKVTVNYTFNLLPFLKTSAFSMSATSETAIEQ